MSSLLYRNLNNLILVDFFYRREWWLVPLFLFFENYGIFFHLLLLHPFFNDLCMSQFDVNLRIVICWADWIVMFNSSIYIFFLSPFFVLLKLVLNLCKIMDILLSFFKFYCGVICFQAWEHIELWAWKSLGCWIPEEFTSVSFVLDWIVKVYSGSHIYRPLNQIEWNNSSILASIWNTLAWLDYWLAYSFSFLLMFHVSCLL